LFPLDQSFLRPSYCSQVPVSSLPQRLLVRRSLRSAPFHYGLVGIDGITMVECLLLSPAFIFPLSPFFFPFLLKSLDYRKATGPIYRFATRFIYVEPLFPAVLLIFPKRTYFFFSFRRMSRVPQSLISTGGHSEIPFPLSPLPPRTLSLSAPGIGDLLLERFVLSTLNYVCLGSPEKIVWSHRWSFCSVLLP